MRQDTNGGNPHSFDIKGGGLRGEGRRYKRMFGVGGVGFGGGGGGGVGGGVRPSSGPEVILKKSRPSTLSRRRPWMDV